MFRPKYLYAMIRIRNDKFATFLDYYHNNSDKDAFKEILNKIIYDHCETSKITFDTFKSPVTAEGFYFNTIPTTKCKNLSARPCIINDIYESDAYCKLKIQPYDFVSDKKRIVGIKITIIEANAKFDKN